MKAELLSTSVVVIARDHNPTILHPAFLASQGIVPTEWEPVDAPVCTPAFSTVRYANGISLSVDSNRLVVDEDRPRSLPPWDSRVPKLALDYVEKLPHVRYSAVGVNFRGFSSCDDPERLLIGRFLKSGPWNDELRQMKSFGSRFVYHLENVVLRISLDSGTVRRDETKQPGIIFNGNYHTDLSEEKCLEELRTAIGHWSERCSHFASLASVILGLED